MLNWLNIVDDIWCPLGGRSVRTPCQSWSEVPTGYDQRVQWNGLRSTPLRPVFDCSGERYGSAGTLRRSLIHQKRRKRKLCSVDQLCGLLEYLRSGSTDDRIGLFLLLWHWTQSVRVHNLVVQDLSGNECRVIAKQFAFGFDWHEESPRLEDQLKSNRLIWYEPIFFDYFSKPIYFQLQCK